MEIDLSRFRDTFFQEAAEHLEAMEAGLLCLRAREADGETLSAIFRCAHSIKAGAGTFGFTEMARFTHVLESLLDRMRNGQVDASPERTELLLRSVDVLRMLVNAASRDEVPTAMWERVVEELDSALVSAKSSSEKSRSEKSSRNQVPASATAGPHEMVYRIQFQAGPDLFRLGMDPLLVIRDLATLGSLTAELDDSRLPPLESLDPETCYLGWRLRLRTTVPMEQIRDVFAFVEDISTVSIESLSEDARAGDAKPASVVPPATGLRQRPREPSIRVATEKVDGLIDLVGELVIAQSVASQLMNEFTPERLPCLREAIADLDRYTRELQARAMRMRMMPVGTVFSRFPRLVHDTAHALGKDVVLEIHGEETELDKGMIERIADLLTHLVRNAVDHGIEAPGERRAAGKPAEGRLRLNAYHRSGNVVLEVADDGRGLDRDRIRRKAIQQGLMAEGDEISDDQVYALIFRSGFSTAEAVSDLSGRGVGMDVVKKNVEALNGVVALETQPRQGSLFRIQLPLTLAILDGLLLRLGEQTYVIPLTSIVESIRPRPDQLSAVAGQGEVVVVRKEPLPLLRLERMFDAAAEATDPTRGLVVIVEHEGRRWALLVEELLGQQQVVVKSLETNFRKVQGIMGATILGDGRAALILDVAGIVGMARAA